MRFEPFSMASDLTPSTPVIYDRMQIDDIPAAVDLYVDSFPHRVSGWFRHRQHATCFYGDLFELMLGTHGATCFSARHEGRLDGYLILTFPDRRLRAALWRNGLALRIAGHVLTGRFGWSSSLLTRAAVTLLRPDTLALGGPHVYVVAVAPERRGQGIGSQLLYRARAACMPRFRTLWLYAEVDNQRAVDLYRRLGFRIVESDRVQHAMMWEFEEGALQPTSGKPQAAEGRP